MSMTIVQQGYRYNPNVTLRRLKHADSQSCGKTLGAKEAATRVCENWYSEEPQYDYSSNNFNYDTSHFSQLVWDGWQEGGRSRWHNLYKFVDSPDPLFIVAKLLQSLDPLWAIYLGIGRLPKSRISRPPPPPVRIFKTTPLPRTSEFFQLLQLTKTSLKTASLVHPQSPNHVHCSKWEAFEDLEPKLQSRNQ